MVSEKASLRIVVINLLIWMSMLATELKYKWIESLWHSGNFSLEILGILFGLYILPIAGIWMWITIWFLDLESREDVLRRVIREEMRNTSQNFYEPKEDKK